LRHTYEKPIADGCNTCGRREAFLILIETDTGITGIGEAATFGLPLAAFREVLDHHIAPLLLGENPLSIEYLWEKLLWNGYAGGRKGIVRGVASGVDIALWDIMGKVCNMPLFRILGANNTSVNAYASAGFYGDGKTVDDLKYEMEQLQKQGYQAFKMKVGRAGENEQRMLRYMSKAVAVGSLQQDMERVSGVRQMIGKDTCLMLDMNNTWGFDTVLEMTGFLNEMNIYSIEEPICGDDDRGYERLAGKLNRVMISGGENEQGLDRYRHLIETGALDMIQANIGWSGGITEVRNIAALCKAHHKMFAPHSFFSAVLIAANIQLSASLSNAAFIESEENANPLRTELLKTPFERGCNMEYLLPEKPGLGIELNWDTVEKYHI